MLKFFTSVAIAYMLPGIALFAQKQNFDMVSYTAPKGWQQQQNEGGVQFSVTDNKTGAYAIILITKATASEASATDNFNADWIKLVKASVQVNDAPAMQAPAKEDGWDIISGIAHYTDGAQKGLATQLTATSGGQMVSVVLMTNAQQYQSELLMFLHSLELTKARQSNNTATTTPSTNIINASLTGKIWEAQSLEKQGAAFGSMSGFYTGGFWLYQYKFNADGTYHFVYNAASAMATNPVNVLQYENGTYTVNGNSITITPLSGANEEWSVGKINNGMSAETIRKVLQTRVKRLKSTTRKLEKITYPFTVEYWQGNNANALCLKHTQDTQREGSPGQNDQSCFFEVAPTKTAMPANAFK
ncbi:lipocalin family protein [Niabella sp. CJ426]|uniref:lipocalin family protein n=1 Tax=Niabella sp. CJ426 TaxID=3393740 RepID=UPI003D02B462